MTANSRWIRRTSWGLLVLFGLTGCHKPYIMTELDYSYYNSVSPETVEAPVNDVSELVPGGAPRTVVDPTSKKDWMLTIEDVKRITLQNNKRIEFLGYEPGIAGTDIDLQLSRFDAVFGIGGQWGYTDRQVQNIVEVIGTNALAVNNKTFSGSLPSNTSAGASTDPLTNQTIPGQDLINLSKRNAAGGLSTIFYNLDYTFADPQGGFTAVNPAWTSRAGVRIEQPLLQGAGVEFNRAPILIARANHETAIKDFEREVQTTLRDVENAYWDLYFSYQDLYSREAGMQQALATWQKEKRRSIVGTVAASQVAQAREQYEAFRAQRLVSLSQVLSTERELRELMGLPPDDEYRIIPADTPSFARYEADWALGVAETMQFRPDIESQRFAVRAAEVELMRQRNGLLPDLTVGASWSLSGLDDQWDQSLDRLSDADFEAWTLSVRWRRQIGERSAHASVRRAQLSLSEARAELHNREHTALHELQAAYQELVSQYELILVQKDRREAATEQLRAQEQVYRVKSETIDILLRAQTAFAEALRDESQALVNYNKALVEWEFVRGRILESDNVVLAEQRISLVGDKLRRDRAKWWHESIPLALHPGTHVHGDLGCPENVQPLYPDRLWADPGEIRLDVPNIPIQEEPVAPEQEPPPSLPIPESEQPEALPNTSASIDGKYNIPYLPTSVR